MVSRTQSIDQSNKVETRQLVLHALPGIPEVQPGDDVAAIVCAALISAEIQPQPNDIIAIAQKIISKAENRFAYLDDVTPSARAIEVAEEVDKNPHLVELILSESQEISRKRRGVLVVRHKLGFVSANAGIDHSNVPQIEEGRERLLLLPLDPDGSAEKIAQAIEDRFGVSIGIVITDSHGRPHRVGTVGVAIGVARIQAVLDERGKLDREGNVLKYTDVGVADEIAAAAGLLMGASAESTPIIHLRGLNLPFSTDGTSTLFRSIDKDLYR